MKNKIIGIVLSGIFILSIQINQLNDVYKSQSQKELNWFPIVAISFITLNVLISIYLCFFKCKHRKKRK